MVWILLVELLPFCPSPAEELGLAPAPSVPCASASPPLTLD